MAEQNPAGALVRRLLDNFVYLPVGVSVVLQEQLPTLVERGRNQVAMAKTIGQFAAQFARGEVERRVGELLGPSGKDTPSAATTESAESAEASEPAAIADTSPAKAAASEVASSRTADSAPQTRPPASAARKRSKPTDASLAIDGYDSLPATNILGLLTGLTARELKAIAAYEEQNRARRTILHRIDALLAES